MYMNKKLLIILPHNYIDECFVDGYKKDSQNFINFFSVNKIRFELYYYKSLYFYNSSGVKFSFFNFFVNNYSNSIFFFFPYYSFRILHLFFLRKVNIVYVADSIFKTSLYAFRNNGLLFHRVFFSYFFEFLLKKDLIITSSIEEFLWFSSCNFKYNNLYLIPPIPSLIPNVKIVSNNCDLDKILFLGVNGKGIDMFLNTLRILNDNNFSKYIHVTSKNLILSQFHCYPNLKIRLYSHIDDLNSFIVKFNFVIITDIGGSGLCNRALHVRSLGINLISTVDGLRGTNLLLDKNVLVFRNEVELSNILFNSSLKIEKNNFYSIEREVKFFDTNLDKLINHVNNLK